MVTTYRKSGGSRDILNKQLKKMRKKVIQLQKDVKTRYSQVQDIVEGKY